MLLVFVMSSELCVKAEIINLVCTDDENFSINFTVDTNKNTVSTANVNTKKVRIDDGMIVFLLDVDKREYLYIIKRRFK
jgi:hypothetical protein